MASKGVFVLPLFVALVALLGFYLDPIRAVRAGVRTARLLGVFREDESVIRKEGLEVIRITDTAHCEDLHRHDGSGLLFMACESSDSGRHRWFPPLAIFDDVAEVTASAGSIVIIDPKTMESKRLKMEGFSGPFCTHGIDVLDDDASRESGVKAVFIFAVNHRPNEAYYHRKAETKTTTTTTSTSEGENKQAVNEADSVIEVFRYVIGTNSVQHIRTVGHELVTTPNDIMALSPTSFLVTNDHWYRRGLMRKVEDFYAGAGWSTTISVEFDADPAAASAGGNSNDGSKNKQQDARLGVRASVALRGLNNNNGLGWGRTADEVVIVSAVRGTAYFGRLRTAQSHDDDDERAQTQTQTQTQTRVQVQVQDQFEAESMLDNPSYFVDPYANSTFNATGFVLAGLSRGIYLAAHVRDKDARDGAMVWLVRDRNRAGESTEDGGGGGGMKKADWGAEPLLHDDGEYIRTASAAVLVALDPAETAGRRQAWLFVTGFFSKNVIAVKINL